MRDAALADAAAGGRRDRRRPLSRTAARHPDHRQGSRRRRRHADDGRSRCRPRVAAADAPVVQRLREAGAIVIGKTNLHEFAFGTTSDETAFGPVRHPLDPSRSPGGSSGGSAVALLEGMCFGSVGTDTGGSIRIPAAACGIVGLKPTLGELPCDGVVAAQHHARSRRAAGALGGRRRPAVPGDERRRASTASRRPAARLTFGVPRRYFFDRLDPARARLLERSHRRGCSDAGYTLRDDRDRRCASARRTSICTSACRKPRAITRRRWPSTRTRYSPGVRLRLEMGRYILAEDYVRAMRLRASLTAAVDRALERCDALLLPTLPIPAPPIGASDGRRRRRTRRRCARRC